MRVLQRRVPKGSNVGWVKSPRAQTAAAGQRRDPRRLRHHPSAPPWPEASNQTRCHPDGPALRPQPGASPVLLEATLRATNTSPSLCVPPPVLPHRERAAPPAPGRQEGGGQELFRTRAAGTVSLARVSAAQGGRASAAAPCPPTAPRPARATQRFPAGKGLCWKLLRGHKCLGKKKKKAGKKS